MKVIAATSHYELLVSMTPTELATITEWRNPNRDRQSLDLYDIGKQGGKSFDVTKEFVAARDLLQSFRGIAPALRQSAKRLENLAAEVELHEPDVSLLPKKES